jgi:hypothetical protein
MTKNTEGVLPINGKALLLYFCINLYQYRTTSVSKSNMFQENNYLSR